MFNPVAKHAHKYNKSVKHKDRKALAKRGYRKHKKAQRNDWAFSLVG